MSKISVIIPVFNGEKYLKRCLNSLINQTIKDYELIIVNDGSTDNTNKILNEYKKKYQNIVIVERENKGISESRNDGLKIATGKYICFVDSDDFVDNNYLEELLNKMESDDFDFVTANIYLTYPNKEKKIEIDLKYDCLTLSDLKKYFLSLYPVVWNKMYKKILLKDLKFSKTFAEDVKYLYELLPKVKKIGKVNKYLYHYVQRDNSESHVYDKRIFDYVKNFNILNDYYKKNNYFFLKKEFEYIYVRYLYATFIKRVATLDKKDYLKGYKLVSYNVKNNFPSYRRNKYFYQNLRGIYLLTFNKLTLNIIYWRYHEKTIDSAN